MADITTVTTLYLNDQGQVIGPGRDAPSVFQEPGALISTDATRFGRPRTPWSSSSRATFPFVGKGYHEFENDIMKVAVPDQPAVVDKWVRRFREQNDGVTAAQIVAHRARLQAFVTSYNASYP